MASETQAGAGCARLSAVRVPSEAADARLRSDGGPLDVGRAVVLEAEDAARAVLGADEQVTLALIREPGAESERQHHAGV